VSFILYMNILSFKSAAQTYGCLKVSLRVYFWLFWCFLAFLMVDVACFTHDNLANLVRTSICRQTWPITVSMLAMSDGLRWKWAPVTTVTDFCFCRSACVDTAKGDCGKPTFDQSNCLGSEKFPCVHMTKTFFY